MNKDDVTFNTALSIPTKTTFKDGTTYMRMANGSLVRSSKRAFEIRKEAKRLAKLQK